MEKPDAKIALFCFVFWKAIVIALDKMKIKAQTRKMLPVIQWHIVKVDHLRHRPYLVVGNHNLDVIFANWTLNLLHTLLIHHPENGQRNQIDLRAEKQLQPTKVNWNFSILKIKTKTYLITGHLLPWLEQHLTSAELSIQKTIPHRYSWSLLIIFIDEIGKSSPTTTITTYDVEQTKSSKLGGANHVQLGLLFDHLLGNDITGADENSCGDWMLIRANEQTIQNLHTTRYTLGEKRISAHEPIVCPEDRCHPWLRRTLFRSNEVSS